MWLLNIRIGREGYFLANALNSFLNLGEGSMCISHSIFSFKFRFDLI
jgi:hypothetical protein